MAPVTAPRSRKIWLIIAAGAVILATLTSITAFLNSRVAGRSGWADMLFGAGLWLIFGVLTYIPYSLSYRFPFKRNQIGTTLLIHLSGAVAVALLWTFLGDVLAVLLVRRPGVTFARYYAVSILTNFSLCLFLYFAVLGCIYAFSYYREAREREAQQAQLAAQLAEARLGALRMQLNPHFLFNSLNAITVLVRDQNTRDASRMLELLSGVLRQVLQNERRQEVTLEEELEFLDKYLAIEQVRFSDRLQVKWSVDAAVRDALVPEFILQPLVENAVRHGIAKRSEAGFIEINGTEIDGELLLRIRDNGPGYFPNSPEGLGITNTRRRLETMYDDEAARLEVRNLSSGGTEASVTLPLRRKTIG